RHARIERERLVLARVVVAGAVADLHRALLCGIEHPESGHELARGVRADAKPSLRERLELLGESLRAAVQRIEAARETRCQTPHDITRRLDARALTRTGTRGRRAGCEGCGTGRCLTDKGAPVQRVATNDVVPVHSLVR